VVAIAAGKAGREKVRNVILRLYVPTYSTRDAALPCCRISQAVPALGIAHFGIPALPIQKIIDKERLTQILSSSLSHSGTNRSSARALSLSALCSSSRFCSGT
jgi:hypothetical protein